MKNNIPVYKLTEQNFFQNSNSSGLQYQFSGSEAKSKGIKFEASLHNILREGGGGEGNEKGGGKGKQAEAIHQYICKNRS